MNGAKANTSSANSDGRSILGLETRFGPDWPGRRCLAKTRKGGACHKPALKNKSRCQLHGGRSTGPRTEAGRARISALHYKHGMRTNQRIASDRERAHAHREIWAALRERIALMIADGLLPKNYKP